MKNPFESEPTASAGVILALLYIAAAFGAPIDESQKKVLQDNLPIVLPGIAGFVLWVRSMVFAPDTVKEEKAEAFQAGALAAKAGTAPVVPAGDPFVSDPVDRHLRL